MTKIICFHDYKQTKVFESIKQVIEQRIADKQKQAEIELVKNFNTYVGQLEQIFKCKINYSIQFKDWKFPL